MESGRKEEEAATSHFSGERSSKESQSQGQSLMARMYVLCLWKKGISCLSRMMEHAWLFKGSRSVGALKVMDRMQILL